MNNIIAKLDELSEAQAELDVLRLDYEAKYTAIITQVKDQLDALDAEYKPKMNMAAVNISAMTEDIKILVIANGASIKGTRLHAIYNKGRVSWDTKGLDGYSVAHPELAAFRNTGEPSVTIRAIK